MPAESAALRRKPWQEANPVVSGVLAYLIPGAGHMYQGRWFKGVLYFVCILGSFFGGMRLGEGGVVYHVPSNRFGMSLNYLAQVCVGLPALPAFVQARRAKDPSNRPMYELREPLSAPFQGQLINTAGPNEPLGMLVGTVRLETVIEGAIPETRGKFTGTLDGKPVELELAGGFMLDRPINAGTGRRLECRVEHQAEQAPHHSEAIRGEIPRSLWDAYCSPPDQETLQDRHGRLGKFYDLAIAFTMIAGLLNVLAIWDAVEGPAYGFGDELLVGDGSPTDSTLADAAAASGSRTDVPPAK